MSTAAAGAASQWQQMGLGCSLPGPTMESHGRSAVARNREAMDQFSDDPEIEVAFQIPDPANAAATKLLTQRVTRGMTGVVISLRRPDAGQGRGSQVLCIIDSWEGDSPSTRVITRPWP